MNRRRPWIVFIGVILLGNAAVILSGADGRIEGIVGGVICAVGGTLNVVFAFRRPQRGGTDDGRISPERDSA